MHLLKMTSKIIMIIIILARYKGKSNVSSVRCSCMDLVGSVQYLHKKNVK